MGKIQRKKGISLLGVILLCVVLIFILSYFGVSIRSIMESSSGQENISYVREGVDKFWNNYLKKAAFSFWQNFVVEKKDNKNE